MRHEAGIIRHRVERRADLLGRKSLMTDRATEPVTSRTDKKKRWRRESRPRREALAFRIPPRRAPPPARPRTSQESTAPVGHFEPRFRRPGTNRPPDPLSSTS